MTRRKDAAIELSRKNKCKLSATYGLNPIKASILAPPPRTSWYPKQVKFRTYILRK